MSAVKALQQWCKIQCNGYRDVSITNMTTSFRDGLAFCALIHKHRPDLINFDSLKKDDVYDNNKLAFSVAEEQLGIPALLDAEDMLALRVPDRLSVLTYVSQYYNYFHGRSPIGGMAGVKRPAEEATEQPSGKKNQPITAKAYPGSSPYQPPPSPSPLRPSPKQGRSAAQKEGVSEPRLAGTLSNKCVSCQKHVHLVQRHLVDGRLYHRNCAKCAECSSTLLSGASTAGSEPGSFICSAHQRGAPPLQERHDNTPAVPWRRVNPRPTAGLTPNPASTPASKLGPSWLTHRPAASTSASTLSSTTASTPPSASTLASTPASKPGPSWLTSRNEKPSTPPSSLSSRPTPDLSSLGSSGPSTPSTLSSLRPVAPSTLSSLRPVAPSTLSSLRPVAPSTLSSLRPVATPRTSSSSKTQQARAHFFQSDTTTGLENQSQNQARDQSQVVAPARSLAVGGQGEGAGPGGSERGGRGVSVVVNLKGGLGGGKKVLGGASTGGGQEVTLGEGVTKVVGGAKVVEVVMLPREDNSKKEAAAFLSKKITTSTEVNNNTKPAWTTAALKKTDNRPADMVPPKKETDRGMKGRVKLKADPSILADLGTTFDPPTPSSRSALWEKTPDKGSPKPVATPVPDSSSSPADWRSKLKPVSKETKTKDSPSLLPDRKAEAPSRPWAASTGNSQVSGPTSPGTQGVLNGKSSSDLESRPAVVKPDYIPKQQILSELEEIEISLNDLETRGVLLETQLRCSEEEGEEDSVMDELMIDWFNLIRNKQVAMRRESELVYIARNQDLEEEQPSVEQELRRLMDKPDHLKTEWDRRREEELMVKLVEIVNDRNAIIEGLDDDRLREEEEDQQLDIMMKNLDVKKDKTKKKKLGLFSWGKKES